MANQKSPPAPADSEQQTDQNPHSGQISSDPSMWEFPKMKSACMCAGVCKWWRMVEDMLSIKSFSASRCAAENADVGFGIYRVFVCLGGFVWTHRWRTWWAFFCWRRACSWPHRWRWCWRHRPPSSPSACFAPPPPCLAANPKPWKRPNRKIERD